MPAPDLTPGPLLALIRRFEGCRLAAYRCPAGVWTCGWGSTGPDVRPGTVWTQPQADERLRADAGRFSRAVAQLSPGLWLAGDARHAAIADFAYNLGLARYKASTLKRRVDAGDWPGAAEELVKWVWGGGKKLPGLVTRRAAEARLILGNDFNPSDRTKFSTT